VRDAGRTVQVAQKRVPTYIPGFGKSYGLLSDAPNVDTAVIFVHGFGGKPTSTWKNFHELADEYSAEYPWWATSDMFFYAYESLHTPIRYNATLLGNFADSVWRGAWMGIDPADPNLKYRDLIFTGHSEGGVVIRRLVLDRYQALELSAKNATASADKATLAETMKLTLNSDYVLRSYLRLFAPACKGTNFSSWAGFLTSFAHLVSAIAASSLVRNELMPESPVLRTLEAGTEKAHADFGEIRALYTRPLFGVPDQIVYSESYQGEEPFWDRGYDHFSVCKPEYAHKRPLEFVCK
jgi:pimeloyl-ACP methyl ester carboxylesterase